MSAHLSEEQLNRFAEGSLEAPERAAAARHLEECAPCRAEVTGLRTLLSAAAALPKSIEPPRDLWPEIRMVVSSDARTVVRHPDHPAIRPSDHPAIRWGWVAVAAAILLVVGIQFVELTPSNAWRVALLEGTPRIGTAVVTGSSVFRVGDWLETDPVSRARIAVGRIGHVEVQPRTRVRLLDARAAVHRLALARGAISARVDAPPRLFIVETPAGTAIDLGCAYTLDVDSLGNGALHVTAGWVEFAWRGRRSVVPLGFTALTRPRVGPGVPTASDATPALRQALLAFDFGGGGGAAARAALQAARSEDAVSVWHLLARTEGRLRADVYARLVQLVPPPEDVNREAVLALDPVAVERYWSVIRRIAWRREILRGVKEIDPTTGVARD